ncbi:pre-60S factor REI1 [Nematocida minor]|uniref:pre-60S factor REI1 n=1 Tax=Nematocida minor TaxID=1912983 RepID=UPI0022202389|nr:pre-60S factor REI1 [Nematocida minor]KAI5191308.1 pre-60S factor REI1 [Nematocida minor]
MKCRTCNEIIENKTEHYQSAVHEENIKRKLIGLDPVKEVEAKEKDAVSAKLPEGRKMEETGVYKLKDNECLFCSQISTNYMEHLETHGFKLLLPQYIINVDGLIKHLKEKVSYCMCTCCNKRFSCINKARNHMESMNHMNYINTEEYDSFYEYPEKGVGYVSEDGSELYLPSGRVAGNKKYNKYYAQTLRDIEYYKNMRKTYTQVVAKEAPKQSEEEKIKIRQFTERMERNKLKIGKSNNSQKHFREDWLQ